MLNFYEFFCKAESEEESKKEKNQNQIDPHKRKLRKKILFFFPRFWFVKHSIKL